MLRATVPEAPVNEDSDPRFREDKIRASENARSSPPPGDRVSPQEFCKCDLGVFVSVAADARHYLRALLFIEDVAHEATLTFHGFSALQPN